MWISATYTPGEFAFWRPDGSLDRVVQAGAGQGPGEFRDVTDLIVDTAASRIHVLSGSNRIVTFSMVGTPLETRTLSAAILMGTLTESGDILTSSLGGSSSRRALLITEDTVRALGTEKMLSFGATIAQAAHGAAWTGEPIWYELDVHRLDDAQHTATFRRHVDWFPGLPRDAGLEDAGPLLMLVSFTPDQSQIYTRVSRVPDVDAPPMPSPSGGEALPGPIDDISKYHDAVVEVFTVSGELLASTRFDDDRETPYPLGGGSPRNFWYRIYDDVERSIEIFRPKLVQRARGG